MLSREAQDAYFDYDKSDIRDDARQALTRDADLLKRIFAADPTFSVVIEGHCDERGSAEYNLGLGTGAPPPPRTFWWGWACRPIAFEPSAMARSARCARTPPRVAINAIATRIWRRRNRRIKGGSKTCATLLACWCW